MPGGGRPAQRVSRPTGCQGGGGVRGAVTTFPATRIMAALTAAYGVFALARPQHLPDAMNASGTERGTLLGFARAYGVRDLAISSAALSGRPRLAPTAAALRIASDLSDCVLLLRRTGDLGVRAKIAGATLGWATLNAVALARDLRRR